MVIILKNIIRYSILFMILLITLLLGGLYFITHHHCIDLSALEQYNPGKASILLDDEGHEWGRFELDKRAPVVLKEMPKHLIKAFIAAEDWNFFSHSGISYKGIIRAALINLYHGKKKQGGSTITQQLVKLLFFNAQKSFRRKIKEQFYTFLVEQQFTKEQIMEIYLNHLDFGCGIFGVEAAAQRFWQKSIKNISLEEAATLAGMIRAPYRYNPILNPQDAQKRRNIILNSMKKLGFITQEEFKDAQLIKIDIKKNTINNCGLHAKESIRLYLENMLGKNQLYTQGYIIQTTINKKMQLNAQRIFDTEFSRLIKELPHINGALISMDTKTGDIKAMIGGTDFNTSPFNRAYARRQMGSIFKPLVYAAAIEKGAQFNDTEIDESIIVEMDDGSTWEPQNNTRKFKGQMTLAHALSISNNIIAIKTCLNTGLDPIIDLAKKCHLTGPLPRYPSLALGCIDSTLKEAVGAFNIFANNGIYVEPHLISWIKDQWGTKIWRYEHINEQVLSHKITSQVARVLSIGMHRFKQYIKQDKENIFDTESIGKTGTTNDCRTDWFCGSTPELTTGIYVGRDDNQSMGQNVYAISTAFPIWYNLYKSIDFKQKKFTVDPSLKEVHINLKTGNITEANNKRDLSFPLLLQT